MSIPQYQAHFQDVGRRQSHSSGQVRAGILMGIVLLAPIPVASNHPLAWLFWAILLGAIATFYSVRHELAVLPESLPSRVALGLGSVFLLFASLQALPAFPVPRWLLFAYSTAPSVSFLGAIRTFSYLLFFILMVDVCQRPKIARLMSFILIIGTTGHALAAMSALRLFGDTALLIEKTAYFGVATGGFGNRNAFAMFLGMGLVLGLAQSRGIGPDKEHAPTRLLSLLAIWVALAIILLALIATQSRMGIAATACASLLALPRSRTSNLKSIAILAVLGFGLIAVFGQGLSDRFTDLNTAITTRGALYIQVWDMIRARPLGGHGIDSFPIAFEQFHAAPVTAGLVWDKAHSVYLTLWAEMGLIIGSIPIVLGIIAAAVLRTQARSNPDNQHLTSAAMAALLLVGLHSLFDFGLEIEANMFLFLTLIAMGSTAITHPKDQHFEL
ncbi:MAG: O-antigen ligase family protein [Marinosulfonomonas sp.]|nr:O-antigen ligase family protein [Marinosulfonomonas sp.]